MSRWFPYPEKKEDIIIVSEKDDYIFSEICKCLFSQHKKELTDKVGVLPGQDGSGKSSTRLLLSEGYIIKTDISSGVSDLNSLKNQWHKKKLESLRFSIYHPDKDWFIIKSGELYYPSTICPELKTVQSLDDKNLKIRYLFRIFEMGMHFIIEHKQDLDLNPSNFAFDQLENIYYLDDETYIQSSLTSLGEFFINRIRTETYMGENEWKYFARKVNELLDNHLNIREKMEIRDSIKEYSFPEIFRAKQDRILAELVPGLKKKDKVFKLVSSDKVGILADIHSNLPALREVIKECTELGVNKYFILGDIVGYGPFPSETIETLAKLESAKIIQGNHDFGISNFAIDPDMSSVARQTALWTYMQLSEKEKKWLASLEKYYRNESYMMVHGAILNENYIYPYIYDFTYRDNLDKADEMGLKLLFFGHTHVPSVYRKVKSPDGDQYFTQFSEEIELYQQNQINLVNPGSVGQPRNKSPESCFAVWERNNNKLSFHSVSYPVEETIKAIKEKELPERLILRLEKGI